MSENNPYAGAASLVGVFVLVYIGIGGWRYVNARIANEKAESQARVKQIQSQPVVVRQVDAPATGIVTSDGKPHPSFPQPGVVSPGAKHESYVGKCIVCGEVRVYPAGAVSNFTSLGKAYRYATCGNDACNNRSVYVYPPDSRDARSLLVTQRTEGHSSPAIIGNNNVVSGAE